MRPGIPQLTGLRFFAAATVLVSHLTTMGFLGLPQAVIDALDGGRPAVSLFFVLSGFVLAYTYADSLDRPGALQRYYVARFARIYPVHILALTVALLGFIVATQVGKTQELLSWFAIKPHEATAMLASSFAAQLAVLTAWLPFAGINQPWNGAAWSISCELFFYAVFPWLLMKLRGRSGKWLAYLSLFAWLAQGAMILAVRGLLPANRSGFLVSQFPVTHLFEFVLGVVCAVWFLSGGKEKLAPHANLLLAAACVGIGGLALGRPVSPAYYLGSPLFGLMILSLAAHRGPIMLSSAPMVLLGEASFALYLIHIPVLNLARVLGVASAYGVPLVVGVVLLSIAIFKTYEEPVRKMIRNAGGRDARPQLARDQPS